jgi:hypothetical protein
MLISCLATALVGFQLLHPVETFGIQTASFARQPCAHRFTSSKHLQTRLTLASSNASADNSNSPSSTNPIRKVSNFSLSAIRTTILTATGFSLTTLRATLRAATGISLSQQLTTLVSTLTGLLPAGVRYFLQPFLILYYAPQMIVRYYIIGPNRKYVEESRKGHELVVEGWRKAVQAAELAQEGGYWPVHLNGECSDVYA